MNWKLVLNQLPIIMRKQKGRKMTERIRVNKKNEEL